ncbi:MAG: methylated-DNA--[protein]-cysteine S-methyltransferase [Phycisphaerae bacterium]|nr:methylated-DNA--[protein]-cysteine S-methyltransferase [Phycisphaerae bacterium]
MPVAKSKGPRWYTVFPTPWGPMGAAANESGVCRVVLPHYQADDLANLLAWEHPGAIRDEARFAALADACRNYFNGSPTDFADVAIDLPAEGTFAGKVYRACMAIPFGQTKSYRELALQIGREDAARAVATMMSKNPTPLVVPCHRVIYSDGRAGGFSAEGGPAFKQRLLRHESQQRRSRC